MSHSTTGKGSSSHTHILIFPFPAQGHFLPLLDLTHQLVLRGLALTILVTPKNLPHLNPLLSTHPSIQTLVFPFPPHPKVPPGVENVKDIGNVGNFPIISALSKLHDPIVQWFNSHPSPPIAIISDFFLGWTNKLAHHLGIPRIVFYSSGAFLVAVLNHCWQNIEDVCSKQVVDFPHLPGSPAFKRDNLPSLVRNYRKSDPDSELVKEGNLANIASWACVLNSFDALEGPYLSYLRRNLRHPRVYGVGPLSLIGANNVTDRGGSNSEWATHVLQWLDSCPDGSVLYVCFGSQKLLRKEQMEALASGLEKSGIRLLWVVKEANNDQKKQGFGIIPDGYEERVSLSGKGLVIRGWAPQVLILSHRAVGGFLSHCGWNSVLEGIAAGVMILGWPMEADQFVNARLLVEDMGAGVVVCEGGETVPDSDELGKVIAQSMGGCNVQKDRARSLRKEGVATVSGGGSSVKELDELVELLRKAGEKDK